MTCFLWISVLRSTQSNPPRVSAEGDSSISSRSDFIREADFIHEVDFIVAPSAQHLSPQNEIFSKNFRKTLDFYPA
jgi:hypothetical protein